MNRRDFLSFLSVAPVAVPMVAKAAAAKSEAFWVEGVAGEFVELSAEPFHGTGRKPPAFGRVANLQPINVRPSDLTYQVSEGRLPFGRVYDTGSVADQFDADLALLRNDPSDDSVIGTAETQAHVSTESENEIPTAEADDLCHSAQDTETLSPKLDRRLHRSWGVETGRVGA